MAGTERSLNGKVVAITGAGRGIGEATARALVRSGARVAIGELDLEAGRAVAEQLGDNAAAFELDVTDRASFAAFLDSTEERFGPLDVLINNAGIMLLGRLTDESDERAERMVGVSEAVRLELRGTGVEVSCVMPAVVQTELASGLRPAKGVKPVAPEGWPARFSTRCAARGSTCTSRARSGRSG